MNNGKSKVLYNTDSKPITQKDIEDALVNVGLRKGDIILVHSGVGSFGKLVVFDRNVLLESLINSLKNIVGKEGTIIMPTFTFSFCKNEAFDVENTKSTVGALTEYFRKQPGVSRTLHPNHSVAIWGKHKNELLNIGKGTFDEDSIFGKLHKMGGKIVSFGIPSCNARSFVHYIEYKHGVPYRYMKKFRGKLVVKGKEYEDEFTFYYRYFFILNSMLKLEKYLLERKIMREVRIGDGLISSIRSDELFREGYELLNRDIHFFLEDSAPILKLYNRIMCFFLRFIPWPFRIFNNIVSRYLY